MTHFRRGTALVAVSALAGVALAACGAGNNSGDSNSGAGIIVGTTDKVVSIDPAGSYDNGSLNVQTQVYQYLLNFPAGTTDLTPDAASKCEFATDDPTKYVCTIKPGLTFANGNELTASDVAFSFNRIVTINDPSGPASLLGAMKSVEATDDSTVTFTLNAPNDQTFPQVLVTSAGPIVDEETYPADKVLDDDAAVKANGFSGPYTIAKYSKNQLAEFKANPAYDGTYGKAKTKTVTMKYYAKPENLKLDIKNKDIDVAYRSLTPTDIADLEKTDGINVVTGAGGELRYITFNLETMPGDSPEQKLAIRKAMASSVDRADIAKQVYKDTFTPAYSMVPDGQAGATEAFKDTYGDAPDADAAKKFLDDAGVTAPVTIKLQYNPDHYGSSSGEEYAAIKRQLEASGLFKVDLQSTEWVTYSEEYNADAYPVFQLGWFPDFPDADNYLSPFLSPYDKEKSGNFTNSHYNDLDTEFADDEMTKLLDSERTDGDKASREATLGKIQERLADQVPYLPLLTGSQVAIGVDGIDGLDKTLDASFKFRFTSLSK
ncbi:ABC transporter substrate-binding protein [Aeromicrobium fastidiosum]|uniref:Peptide ABC transporter substrate-binding protein n=1 Tax=Aeromicrobium fastidiosum TaxID=52699 RepID=A0A641AU22_9ACTN|nr:ABC transporter substrate-binding protein [Aeromicrobium fastidiosum]KAA1380368.1 peptide ABC transporter substrate-binding protein [Aeromicrobium fastidiosum]MBP2389936.1 peptide/nickel transport system substrate-binding protein [Aeromicrobium fastidiosum]